MELTQEEHEIKEPKGKKRKRISKKERPNRRGRIIIRNLSFKTTEESLRKHFEEFGNITDIKLLKRPDGKLVGCAFIQYDIVQNAAKAIHHRTGRNFHGRPIICDWAVAKDTYVKHFAPKEETTEVKDEPIEIKDEPTDDSDVVEVKQESESESEKSANEKSSDEENSSDDDDNSDEEEEEDNDENESVKDEPSEKRPRAISNDVSEGKTVFIKNVPFSATNDDLKECMLQFGPIYYALICIDPVTEHSKGTAFIKFVNAEDAEKALSAGTELTLMGNVLDCHKAINKNELNSGKNNKEKTKKDSRNLYLVKEGVVLAGSKAAETVSSADMAKRLQLERWKTQMLRNLNMFVSKFRIVIHNLPISWDDSKLRQLVTKYASKPSSVKECRIMRNLRDIDAKTGKGKSKEYGFVTFDSHEDALKVLRALNNNPNIFSVAKRPIVSFSIENKAIMNRKNKQLEKSRMNNPTYKKYNPETSDKNESKFNKKQKFNNENSNIEHDFSGVQAKEGQMSFRSKKKLDAQSDLHRQKVKERKKLQKLKKKSLDERRKEHIRQPQQKQNTNSRKKNKKNVDGDSDNFSKLVNQYKSKLLNNVKDKKIKSKWYET